MTVLRKKLILGGRCKELYCNGTPVLVSDLIREEQYIRCPSCGKESEHTRLGEHIDYSEWK
jgi:hypothetical protein